MERFRIHYGVIECDRFKPGKEFRAQLMRTRRFTQTRNGGVKESFDICLFRVT
jgi:hypothetical protein